jgi:CubicO group peptidase (beta-lactamase class C family)
MGVVRETIVRAAVLGVALVSLTQVGSAAAGQRTFVLATELLGDDGSALYLRQSGSLVVGFGEHPNGSYAYVLKGTLTADVLTVDFWDVPKGTRSTSGTAIALRVLSQGKNLTTTSKKLGARVWIARSTPLAAARAAGYQGRNLSNLDGAFAGDDGSRHYVQELNGDVVWVGEAGAQPDVHPPWVTVFFGKKSAAGVTGTWTDLSKGLATARGSFTASFPSTGARELALRQTGASRTKTLQPDYALDFDRFELMIQTALDKRGETVAGFAYAIGRYGVVLRSGAWGDRIKTVDGGPKPFTTDTQAQAGSTSKTLTAVALVKALLSRGISLDTPIGKYLPSCWKKGPNVSGYTFRGLLNHTTTLPKSAKCKTDSTGRADPYDCLLRAVEVGTDGIVLPTTPYSDRYNNNGYALMRLLLPAVLDLKNTQAEFELFKCKDTGGVLNAKVSERFVRYLFDEVLKPAGAKASYYPSPDLVAYDYNRGNFSAPGGRPDVSFSRRGGAGYLAISAPDMIRFLGAFDRGELVPAATVGEMKAGNLGFDQPVGGALGTYYTKNGTCPVKNGVSCSAQLMLYPGGYEAYVIVNSNTGRVSPAALLRQAFDIALR